LTDLKPSFGGTGRLTGALWRPWRAVALHRIPRATLDFDIALYTSDLDAALAVLLRRNFGVMAMVAGRDETMGGNGAVMANACEARKLVSVPFYSLFSTFLAVSVPRW